MSEASFAMVTRENGNVRITRRVTTLAELIYCLQEAAPTGELVTITCDDTRDKNRLRMTPRFVP